MFYLPLKGSVTSSGAMESDLEFLILDGDLCQGRTDTFKMCCTNWKRAAAALELE